MVKLNFEFEVRRKRIHLISSAVSSTKCFPALVCRISQTETEQAYRWQGLYNIYFRNYVKKIWQEFYWIYIPFDF